MVELKRLSSERNEHEQERERRGKKCCKEWIETKKKEGEREKERKKEDKETIKKKVVVVDTFFLLHLHTISKSLYFSPFLSGFFCFLSSLNVKKKS